MAGIFQLKQLAAILCVILVLLTPGGCFAAITAGACATGTTGNSAGLATPACNLSAGQLVYLACSNFNGTFTGTPVSDSVGGNTWVQDGSTGTTAGTGKIALFHSVLTAGGASMTVQCNYTGAVDSGIAIQNFTGNAAAGNTDGTAANGSGNSGAPNSGNVTPTVANDVLAGATTHDNAPTTTKGTNFVESFKSDATSLAQPIELEYHIKTDSLAEPADWSLNTPQSWVGVAGMYKPAAAGGGCPKTLKTLGVGCS